MHLDDASTDNGCLRFIPGTSERAILSQSKGDVSCHSGWPLS
ncbi:MAG: phytanoyl-CoA dioxygenase family protein [Kordiimonadaceae bacterium]|nr:phytanoyl-CoA dioxygenase family protein [Kordiimonadaceae bacterium]